MSLLDKLFGAASAANKVANQANETMTKVNQRVSQAAAVQQATSELDTRIYAERLTIESALELATKRREVEMMDPERRSSFEACYEELRAVLEDDEPAKPAAPEAPLPRPSFAVSATNVDEQTSAAIFAKVAGMRADHEAFLSGVRLKLAGDPALKRAFAAALAELQGEHYLPAVE